MGEGKTVNFWIQYLREKWVEILLYVVTTALFIVTCCLYHMENLEMLFYAALLTLTVWLCVGALRGVRYVKQRQRLDEAMRQLEETGQFSLYEISGEDCVLSGEEPAATMRQQLEKLLGKQAELNRRERSRYEEREAERRDYYLMWAHQIKVPIAAMRLLLEEAEDGRNHFRMREELFKIEQYAEMVLTFQRLESMEADLVLQKYELLPLLRQVVRKYSILFINKGLQIGMPETAVRVLTDEKWLSFCLEQLISNSIKYTPTGRISFEVEERGRTVSLTLADTGIGIRPEDLPRVFEKGFTGYNGRMDKRATGIGLYLCRMICTRLQIDISVDSEVGKGTRVRLEIPLPYKSVSLEEEM